MGRNRLILLALISIGLLVVGQTLLKYGLTQVGGVHLLGGDLWGNVRKLTSTPWVFAGLAFYGLSAVLWMDVLSKLEFSKAFPLVSLSYVFSLFIGYVLFHEEISAWRALGVVLVVAGVFLVARS